MKIRAMVLGSDEDCSLLEVSMALIDESIELECFSEQSIWPHPYEFGETKDPYKMRWILAERLERVFKKREFDVVIVGNNGGSGLKRIDLIPKHLHPYTIVVWTDIRGEKVGKSVTASDYKALGLEHFSFRGDMAKKVLEVLEFQV